MKNENNKSKKMLFGLLISGVVGAGALYCIYSAQNRKTPLIKKIGKTISEVGEMIENCDLHTSGIVENIEENMPRGMDVLKNLFDWVDTGLTLWKKFK